MKLKRSSQDEAIISISDLSKHIFINIFKDGVKILSFHFDEVEVVSTSFYFSYLGCCIVSIEKFIIHHKLKYISQTEIIKYYKLEI